MKIIFYKIILEYIPSFHLEVIGAGGAVWGFSEMIGLRTKENIILWKYISLFTTIIFLFRWLFINIKKFESNN